MLGAVVLEDALEVGQQPDQPDVGDEHADADQPLDDHEPRVPSIGSQLVRSAGPTLKSISAKPIAIANEKMICPREISVDHVAVVVLLARGDVRGDRERAEPDRQRLAERDDAADHGQPPDAVALHRRA